MDCIATLEARGPVGRLVLIPKQVVMRLEPRELAFGVGRKS